VSDLNESIAAINTAAERTEATTDFIDNWATYDENSYVTNPNNDVTVPSAQKLVSDKATEILEPYQSNLEEATESANSAAEYANQVAESSEEALTQFQSDSAQAISDFNSDGAQAISDFNDSGDAAITQFETESASAIAQAGYEVVGNFTDGVTVSNRAEAVYLSGDYEGFYVWTGTFPKVVSAGDSPFDEEGWMLAATGYVKQSSAIQLFGQTIDIDLAIPTGQNALSINPTVSDGVTVTVPSDSQYVILGSTS
jgi:hypothetical protein